MCEYIARMYSSELAASDFGALTESENIGDYDHIWPEGWKVYRIVFLHFLALRNFQIIFYKDKRAQQSVVQKNIYIRRIHNYNFIHARNELDWSKQCDSPSVRTVGYNRKRIITRSYSFAISRQLPGNPVLFPLVILHIRRFHPILHYTSINIARFIYETVRRYENLIFLLSAF